MPFPKIVQTSADLPSWITDYHKMKNLVTNKQKKEQQYCCFKFKYFVNDIEVKDSHVIIHKDGKVTFVENHSCDDEDTLTDYPIYDFKYCPFCKGDIIK